jgi:protein-disulfide isomerase
MRSRPLLLLLTLGCGPSLPAPIAAEIRMTPPGQATVIEYVDFECPFCRRLDAALAPVLAKYPGRVRIVRKHVPLTKIHPHADAAARAAVCAEAQGKGDVMADALFRAPPLALTDEGDEALAAQLGLDAAAFHVCLADASTARRIATDGGEFDAIGGEGVPLLFVGRERLEGLQHEATLEAAIRRALGADPA